MSSVLPSKSTTVAIPQGRTDPQPACDPAMMSQLVNLWRMAAVTHSVSFVLIEVNLDYLPSAHDRDWLVSEIRAYASENWIHVIEQGWLGARRYGTLLPNSGPEDGVAYAEQMAQRLRIPSRHICLFVSGSEPPVHHQAPMPIRVLPVFDRMVRPEPRLKRLMDVTLGSLLLLISSPVLVCAAILIRLTSPGPVLFRQQRVGRGGRPFWIYKLRTMRNGAEEERSDLDHHNEQSGLAFKMTQDPRITPVGRLLRRTSVDELPQLLNVLRGEMSLVGPRPLPASDWKPAEGWQTLRHDVKPGMTCTWQIAGRMEIPFDEWMRMDLEYVQDRSHLGDLQILLRTIPAVLFQRGAA